MTNNAVVKYFSMEIFSIPSINRLLFRLNVGNKVFLTTWKMLSQHQNTKGGTICYPGIDINHGFRDKMENRHERTWAELFYYPF